MSLLMSFALRRKGHNMNIVKRIIGYTGMALAFVPYILICALLFISTYFESINDENQNH